MASAVFGRSIPVERVCETCRNVFLAIKAKKRRFCSLRCYHASPTAADNGRKIPQLLPTDPRWYKPGNGGATKGREATGKQLEGLRAGWSRPRSPLSEAHKVKLSTAHMGKRLSPEHAAKCVAAMRAETPEQRKERVRKSGLTRRGRPALWFRGDKNPNWRGGVHKLHATERQLFQATTEYVNWRRSVFERDDFTCQHCHNRGGLLHADHIKPFVSHPELRLDLSNGRTLCAGCHRKTDTWGSRVHLKSGG